MLQHLTPLKKVIQPGIELAKTDVIKRYRALQHPDKILLQLLLMLQFSKISCDESGALCIT